MSVALPTKQVVIGHSPAREKAFAQGITDDGKMAPSDLWLNDWAVSYYYNLVICRAGRRNFIFASGKRSNVYNWFIQELLPNGLVGETTDQGQGDAIYHVMCPYTANGRTFIYFHNDSRYWYISELLENGKLGPRIGQGRFGSYYPTSCTVTVGGVNYVFGSRTDGYWFLQELLPDGNLGAETANGTDSSSDKLNNVCSITLGDTTLLMGQSSDKSFLVYKVELVWD